MKSTGTNIFPSVATFPASLRQFLRSSRSFLIPTSAVLISFLLGALLLIATGQNPIDAYSGLFEGAFGNRNAFAGTLATTTPLLFTALSFLVAFRAGIFNAGSEGQL